MFASGSTVLGIKSIYIIIATTIIGIGALSIIIVAVSTPKITLTSSPTLSPITFAPTTLSPTTLSPTTLSPTSLAPSTLSPTDAVTNSPTDTIPTDAPTTGTPTTLAPTEFRDQSISTTKPNVIFILADDLGINMVDTPQGRAAGLYDGRDVSIKTPQLYKLSEEGVFFERHLATVPVCMPSRYGFLTGIPSGSKWSRIRGNTGSGYDGFFNSAGELSVAQEFKRRGYATAEFGKHHFQTPPSEIGFDYALHMVKFTNGDEYPRFFPEVILEDTGTGNVERRDLTPKNNALGIKTYDQENDKCTREGDKCEYAPDIYHNRSLEWMQNKIDSNTPFFAYLPMLEPHDGKRAANAGIFTLPVPGIVGPIENYDDSKYDGYFGRMKNLASAVTNHLDVRVGEIRDFIINAGVENNTLIIFTSDNGGTDAVASTTAQSAKILTTSGGYRANYPYRGKKRHLLLGGSAVPTIIWYPGFVPAGHTLYGLTDMSDLTKTILDFANVPDIHEQFSGISILDDLVNVQSGSEFSSPLTTREWNFNEICYADSGELGFHADCDFMLTFTSTLCPGLRVEWSKRTDVDKTIGDQGAGYTGRNGGMFGNLTLADLAYNDYVPFCFNYTADLYESPNMCSSGQITTDIESCVESAKQIIVAHRVVPTEAEITSKTSFGLNYPY